MCFGGGPSQAEKDAAAAQRASAEEAKRAQIEELAETKRTDIEGALTGKVAGERGFSGGTGRRSLFKTTSATGAAGYASRFS